MAFNYGQLKVLLADDSRQMRGLVRTFLEALNIKKVEVASDADEAWEILKRFNPDLIISDWNMPPTSGLDFVRRIRADKNSPNPYVPVIMITAYTEEYRVLEARDASVTEFLAKPVTAKGVYDRIKSVVEDTRNFVRTETYFGPDRRRGRRTYDGPDRRKPESAKVVK